MAKYHPPDETPVSIQQFCEFFHISPTTLLTWNKRFKFPITRIRKQKLVIPHEFHMWAKTNAQERSRHHPCSGHFPFYIAFRSLSLAARGLLLELVALNYGIADNSMVIDIAPNILYRVIGSRDEDLAPLFAELERADLIRVEKDKILLLPVPRGDE